MQYFIAKAVLCIKGTWFIGHDEIGNSPKSEGASSEGECANIQA
jgi:hypothetical protein